MTAELIPTDEDREMVQDLSGQGVTHKQIARLICGGIDKKTLYKHFRDELKYGKARAMATVTGKLMDKINSGDSASIFFYLKTQAGWRETSKIDHSSKDGTMTPKGIDASKLSDSALNELIGVLPSEES